MNIKVITIKSIENYYKLKYSLIKKPKINYSEEFNKIALILTSPLGYGDLIMVTPLIKTIRNNFPKAKIDLITDKNIFDDIKEVNNIIIIKGNLITLKNDFNKLKKNKYDLGIVMARGINQSKYLDNLNPKYKLGYLTDYNISANFNLIKNNLKFNKDNHFTENSLNIARSLGLKINKELISPIFSEQTIRNSKKIYSKLNLDKNKKNILIAPYGIWETRRWSRRNYINLIKKLHNKYNIILSGGNDAKNTCEYIQIELKKQNIFVTDISSKLNLTETLYFFKFMNLTITADGGPMHFSLIMRTPTIGLFGPVKPNLRLPLTNQNKFESLWLGDYIDVSLYNYESKTIDETMNGMKEIPVTDVIKKINKLLK